MFPQIACPNGCIFTLTAFVTRRITINVFFAMINVHHFLFDVPSYPISVQLNKKGNIKKLFQTFAFNILCLH